MTGRTALTLSLTIALAGLTGCAAPPPKPIADKPLTLREARDLPVPVGFAMDPAESHLYDRSFRALRFTYVRREFNDLERVVDFYKRTLPGEGWELRWEVGMDDRKLMFERGDEQCRVEIDKILRWRAVRATVEIEPRAS